MRKLRHATAKENPLSGHQLADVFERYIQLEPTRLIASFHAFRDELDPRLLTDRLRALGHKIALPSIIGKGQALAFHMYEPGDTLTPNPIGIQEPLRTATKVEPDIVLVPLLAFDLARNRLGYGGGYYDRTIAELKTRKNILAIGIAYASQQVTAIPTGPHDVPLDKIITEVNIF